MVIQAELAEASANHPTPRTTREDIEYLTDLLRLANKKLAWEKQIASLQKRAPLLLERVSDFMDDPKNPPPEQTRAEILPCPGGPSGDGASQRRQDVVKRLNAPETIYWLSAIAWGMACLSRSMRVPWDG